MKVFLTHDEQLERLKEKGLIIEDEQRALEHLRREGYYNIINCYSELFKSKDKDGNKHYLEGATFDDIMELYTFDKNLRSILYKYTSSIECYVKESIAHEFSNEHGVDEEEYLEADCFADEYHEAVNALIKECKAVIAESTNNKTNRYRLYLAYAKEIHGHIPLWILIRALTFGKASIFFKNMKPEEKKRIAGSYNLTPNQMSTMLEFVVLFRNIVAHGERTFCAKARTTRIPTKLNVMSKLYIPKNRDGSYKYGRSDFFALIICCKYFLPDLEFAGLINELFLMFDGLKFSKTMIRKTMTQMGLVNDGWKNLANVKTELVRQ